ncbi:putative nucleoside-diphosphate-sugar epimerases [Aspergillus saccharolyticus JOP 1030-1]|uniref:Putative nucleoside-diphosphate-sugar epimerase n=1 Tax=Aspergillus saccharolyticus JOP 1030-1 TaxID=1450539 RepID=A0A318ZEI6_9EURO|nr:putative nucleoside-diphosphate-sugar epimerase [Aspergillus saccharolyticus JOP 1030-1]PYH44684.1 putative nucleoside-diphosphate-sugar epimerase [Aspergillus saccharolyticus JOP 1030-1]
MHLILTGATGLIGSAALDAMLRTPEITRISILSRRPVRMAEEAGDPRVQVLLHQDFGVYGPETLTKLAGATGCVWALGVSQNAVTEGEYKRITRDYALAAAEAFAGLPSAQQPPQELVSVTASQTAPSTTPTKGHAPFNFVFVSGAGASTTPNPGPFVPLYGRVKGATERDLSQLMQRTPALQAVSVRPAVVGPAGHTAILPYVPTVPGYVDCVRRWGPRWGQWAPGWWTPTRELGGLVTQLAMGRVEMERIRGVPRGVEFVGGMAVLENEGMRAIGGWK